MSDWHDEFTEPMHDTPTDKNPLIAAMEAAGYTYDGLESTNDNLCFFDEGGQVITMGGWHECEEWLNGVVFDDPQGMNRVEIILHPERFPEKDPGRAALCKAQKESCRGRRRCCGLHGCKNACRARTRCHPDRKGRQARRQTS